MKDAYIVTDLGYNSLPEPYKTISQAEFINKLIHNTIYDTEFRQVKIKNKLYNTKLFYMSEAAYASIDKEDTIEYYQIGCDHEYTSEEIATCLHKRICTKCGLSQIIDSSD